MPTEQETNKENFQRYLKDVWEGGNLAALEQYVSPRFANHNPVPGLDAGIAGERAVIEQFRRAFSDFSTNIETMIAEGDKVAVRWTATGTHTGQFAGVPPSGKAVTMIGVEHLRFADGKIEEVWINFDMAGLLMQLGAMPPQNQ